VCGACFLFVGPVWLTCFADLLVAKGLSEELDSERQGAEVAGVLGFCLRTRGLRTQGHASFLSLPFTRGRNPWLFYIAANAAVAYVDLLRTGLSDLFDRLVADLFVAEGLDSER
jgi:hypothetical protein